MSTIQAVSTDGCAAGQLAASGDRTAATGSYGTAATPLQHPTQPRGQTTLAPTSQSPHTPPHMTFMVLAYSSASQSMAVS